MMLAKGLRGGKRRSQGEWRSLLARFAESGMSVEAFCRSESVSEASFYRWRTRLGEALPVAKPADARRSGFVDLGVLGALPSSLRRVEVKLDLGGGVILHLVHS
jgi:putative transposase